MIQKCQTHDEKMSSNILLMKDSSLLSKQKTHNEEIQINDNLDEMLAEIEKIDPFKNIQGDLIKEDKNKKKELSPLKKVEGVIEYFQNIKTDKEKKTYPKYLSDVTLDILYNKKCMNFNNLCYIKLPLIVISEKYCNSFKAFLSNYYTYEYYTNNKALLKYLILSNNDIKKYEIFHTPKYNLDFGAECISTELINHYNVDQILGINNELNDYFNKNDIKGINIDIYYDNWIDIVLSLFFDFILFYYSQTPEIGLCHKCKKKFIYIYQGFDLFSSQQNYLYNKIYEDIKDNQTYEKTIFIANNMMNNIDISNMTFYEKEKTVVDNSSVNIIYYDENIEVNHDEIMKDSLKFEKVCNGTFFYIQNVKSFIIMLKEFKKAKEYPKFHLICTGSKFENLMKYISQFKDINKVIIAAVIYTMNKNKYSYLKEKYNIIKDIYTCQEEIVEYIKDNKSTKNNKYKVFPLITYDKYNAEYIQLHKIISSQYGKLYQKSSFLTALNILEEYLSSNKANKHIDEFDLKSILNALDVFSLGPRDYIKIIKEYTNDSIYSYFNKWLNEIDSLAIKKIAFFISGLQLSLNIYGAKENKGFNCKSELYRGALFNYSSILNYIKNIGNIITYPSFFSTTLDINVAKDFSRYNDSLELRNGLFSANYIITMNPKYDWIAQGFNINEISYYTKEKEILFQPFCFFKIKHVNVDIDKGYCYIYLELIGKKEIWETSMNDRSSINYIKEGNFIELNKLKK